ncbi:MAG: MATE family efflux transporter [Eubacteriales bacterium]|nr:MATE family efflux transporter [Eubacteriales bacterium]
MSQAKVTHSPTTSHKPAKTRDMTTGTIWKHIILFALPLLVGNLFQQLYNSVDSIIVGNFVSKQALAAVGSTGPVINTLVGFFMGMSTGAGVLISHYFGKKDDKGLHEAIHTTVLLTLLLCVVFTAIGILMVPFMVRFMKTPADVVEESTQYLRIYFAGVSGLMLYNMGSGILRAVGDSKRPLYFLCISSVVNIVLDLVFVVVFHMGIAGVALATVISQIVSAILVLLVLTKTDDVYKLTWKDLHLSPHILRRVCVIGIPAGLQMAVTSFSNVFVQSYINNFGSACMAGWTSYSKIDQCVLLPMQSLSMSATTFVGQNIGAGQMKRAGEGRKIALRIALLVTVSLTVILWIAAVPAIRLFTPEEDVLRYGTIFLRFMSPFYVCCCFNQITAGALRGMGDSTGPMVIMLSCFVVFRQLYLAVMTRLIGGIYVVAFAYPAGWILCSLCMSIYYRRKVRKQPETRPAA